MLSFITSKGTISMISITTLFEEKHYNDGMHMLRYLLLVYLHIYRLDARHNFSPHFYWLYLADMTPRDFASTGLLTVLTLLSLMTLLPQVGWYT
jgi:hypothetical protein